MDRLKIFAMLTILVALIGATAISGCTTGSMVVSPTPAPTAAPTTTQPAAEPTVAPTMAPTTVPATVPQATPVPSTAPAFVKGWGPYPTMGPWTPGDDTFIPTPTPVAGYLFSMPWIDQKIEIPGKVVLRVTGNVENPLYLKMSDLKGYPQGTGWFKNKKGEISTGSGPVITAILNDAKPKPGATTVMLIAPDKTYTLPIADLAGAIVSFESDGSLRSFVPNRPTDGSAQLKNLIEIRIS